MKKIIMSIVAVAMVLTMIGSQRTVAYEELKPDVTVGATGYHKIRYSKTFDDDMVNKLKEIRNELEAECGNVVYLFYGTLNPITRVYSYCFMDFETGHVYIEQINVDAAIYLMG